jgi:hypothetical protein
MSPSARGRQSGMLRRTDGWMAQLHAILPVLAALWLAATQRANDKDLQGTPGTEGY